MFTPDVVTIFTLIISFLNVIQALPLPRNAPFSSHNIHKTNTGNSNGLHNVHVSPISSEAAFLDVSLGDRHRRDMDPSYSFKEEVAEPVPATHAKFDSDIDGKQEAGFDELFDSEIELEVDPTQPPMDDELLRFNNALEQALDYLSEMESTLVEFNLENSHPVTAVEL